MAKAGFWLRGAHGKLAGASIGKGSQGGTVIREIVAPKNPKTTAQMIQRIVWNTVIQAYTKTKEITDHSFEGISPGSACQQEFMKVNVRDLRNRVGMAIQNGVSTSAINDFIPVGSSELAHNTYVIAKGSLPVITLADDEADAVSNVLSATANTYAGVAEALGLQRGDQITLIQIANINGAAQMKYARVILDPINADGTQAEMSSAFVAEGAINLPSPRNTGEFSRLAYDAEVGGISFALVPTSQTVLGAAAIASRLTSDKTWLRSNSELTFKVSAGYLFSLEEALAMTQAGVQTLSDLYLNNAGQGLVANFDEGGSSTAVGISSVYVNGKAVSSAGTTAVAPNNSSSIVINVRNAENETLAAYRINEGNWITGVAASGSHSFSNVSLADGDTVDFSVGDATTGVFVPARVYRGKVQVHQLNPSLTAVSVNGNSILGSDIQLAAASSYAVSATAQDMAGIDSPRLIVSTNSYSVGQNVSAFQTSINLSDGSNSGSVTGSGVGSVHYFYLCNGTSVLQVVGSFEEVDTPSARVTAMTANGTSILNVADSYVMSNNAENPTVNVSCQNLNVLNSPKVVLAVADVAVGGSINLSLSTTIVEDASQSMSFVPDVQSNTTYHAYLTDGAVVIQKCGTIVLRAVPSITGLSVGGKNVASSGTTAVTPGSNVAVVFSTVDADGMYASYKIGSGAWASPVAISAGSASLTIPTLAQDDTVAFAIGSNASGFTPSVNYGGTVVADSNVAITSVTANGIAIPNTGSTDVQSDGNITAVLNLSNADGLYAAYSTRDDAWNVDSTPISGNSKQLSLPGGAGTSFTLAVGTGTSSSTFTPVATYGGTIRKVPETYSVNVEFNRNRLSNGVQAISFSEADNLLNITSTTAYYFNKYISYKVNSGQWEQPKYLSYSQAVNFNNIAVSVGDVVTVATGDYTAGSAFVPDNVFTATVTIIAPASTFEGLKVGQSDFNSNINVSYGTTATVTGTYSGTKSHIAFINADSLPASWSSSSVSASCEASVFNTNGLENLFSSGTYYLVAGNLNGGVWSDVEYYHYSVDTSF